ncbi:L-galactono-1,4-lactone dehydrogenase protein [Thalictrum thalictroides]|uniref:L-galactono-1,4-lactone dehydrogenase protein n=1 Tax=Thalictrum thalictroides TaxID=46969 RepID=A0A7J6V9J4_THATH|nr:L-galactono-1,4-lactone dehydrogenase protein [Thalictrum thalictroides]
MKLVTPAKGTIEVSKEKDPELFYLARCGLGALGVIAEVTIQITNTVVVVKCNPVSKWKGPPKFKPKYMKDEVLQQLQTCFPSGTLAKPSMKDLEYMEELKQLVQSQNIPAPAPYRTAVDGSE